MHRYLLLYLYTPRSSPGHLVVLPYPIVKVNGKLEQARKAGQLSPQEPLRIKTWVIPRGKEPQATEVLPESEGNTEQAVKKEVIDINYSLVGNSSNYISTSLLYTCVYLYMLTIFFSFLFYIQVAHVNLTVWSLSNRIFRETVTEFKEQLT